MRHLTTETLIGLAEGQLSPQGKRSAEQHIETCALCFAEASEWFSVFDSMSLSVLENPPEYATRNCFALHQIAKPVSKIQQFFATVLFDSAMAAATVGVRGVADCQQIVLRAADVDLHIRIGGQPLVVLGQMLRREASHFVAGVPISLLQEGHQIEATITDDLGEFRFGTVPAGNLRLHADLPSFRVIGDFTVKSQESN